MIVVRCIVVVRYLFQQTRCRFRWIIVSCIVVAKCGIHAFQPMLLSSRHLMISRQSCRQRHTAIFEQSIDDDDDSNTEWDSVRRGMISLGSSLGMMVPLLTSTPQEGGAFVETSASSKSTTTLLSSTRSNDDTIIPYSSIRSYKTITLVENGLKVLLVCDKTAIRGQCALTVQAGQFNDPDDLPGCAHLLEHMILSYSSTSSKSLFLQRGRRDFEEWLSDNDRDGASNAFTANQKTCFHFQCPKAVFAEAIERFANLFVQANVESVCRDSDILHREILRVDSELDFDSVSSHVEYIAKAFVNLEHPYSRFSKGSLNSLETVPKQNGIDVGERLIQFFKRYYTPILATLVIVGPQDPTTLASMARPFSSTLFRSKRREYVPGYYPGQFLRGNRPKRVLLYRNSNDAVVYGEETEKIIVEWVLNQDYREKGKRLVTGPQVAFVISQILARRGPGSLYAFLTKRGWIPSGAKSVPRISLPVDVSGFQILKLEIDITLDGFVNRSNIIMALFDAIEAVRDSDSTFILPRQIMAQYCTIAKLFGYTLALRPPDAVELSFDSQVYGLEAVESGQWYRLPSSEDLNGLGINFLRRAVSSALSMMSDPESALIIVTATDNAIAATNAALLSDSIPPLTSPRWLREPISDARLCFEDGIKLKSRVEQVVLSRVVNRDELLAPVFNALVPTVLRQPRPTESSVASSAVLSSNRVSATSKENWTLFLKPNGQRSLLFPRGPPERSCRCCFVVQLLSPRPPRANIRQAARAELWRLSFEYAIADLAELGAPGGLAYDLGFNRYGLRICFLGISQTLPSYARRVVKLLVRHQWELTRGPTVLPRVVTTAAVQVASNARNVSPGRRRGIISSIRSSTAIDVADEGNAFLGSCFGAVCFAEGDLQQIESIQLLQDLQSILQGSIGSETLRAALPELEDLLYKPVWKPRNASSCSIPGVPLVTDACGRIPR